MRGAALLAVALVAAGCGPGPMVQRGVVNPDALAEVRRTLPAIRGLAFRAPVEARTLDRTALRAALARQIDESYLPGDLERLEAVYRRMGLLPENAALGAALLDLYGEEGAGFYDPRTKELTLATAAVASPGLSVRLAGALTGRDLVGELLVSHELTHALQDQHYGLPTEPEPLLGAESDRLLARHALLEGDAVLAGFAYVAGEVPDAATLELIEEKVADLPQELAARYPAVPDVVRAVVAFQYGAGVTFVARAVAEGGFRRVDRVHLDPPVSSEQVLHPARYYETRDQPVAIRVGGTEALEAAGWTPTMDDTLGEVLVAALARRRLPAAEAARVGAGWGGDRLRALARDSDLLLVWMTAWDSPGDAAEFAEALATVAPDARVERRGDRVLALFGPPDGAVDLPALAPAVWSGSGARAPRPGGGEAGAPSPLRFGAAAARSHHWSAACGAS